MTARRAAPTGLLVAFLLVAGVKTAVAQEIRGRVVDERTRRPLISAVVTLLDSDSSVIRRVETDNDGFFRVRPGRPGDFTIEIELLGYSPGRRVIRVGAEDLTVPAFVLRIQVIAVDSIDVEAARSRRTDPAVVGFARASHVIAGARLARLEVQGLTFLSAVRELATGLRVRQYRTPGGETRTCIESVRQIIPMPGRGGGPGCQWVAVIVDGIQIGDPEREVRAMHLDQFESVEYFTPVEAGYRFGMDASSAGALVLWSRGRGPHVDPARNKH